MLARRFTRFHELRLRLEHHRAATRLRARLWEICLFVLKQAWACLFGGVLLALVLLSRLFYPAHAHMARYDALFLAALVAQLLLLVLRLETLREARVILVFHLVGTLMELFKTHIGSWTYPEPCLFRIGHVPLFSGFMYASVGSYLARVTRILNLQYSRYPKPALTAALSALIYINFFTHHLFPDLRSVLFLLVVVLFGPTWVYYRPYQKFRRMPLLLGFALITLFLFAAENIGTYSSIWLYPSQRQGWHLVHLAKFGSWFLLMIISFSLVMLAHPAIPYRRARRSAPFVASTQ